MSKSLEQLKTLINNGWDAHKDARAQLHDAVKESLARIVEHGDADGLAYLLTQGALCEAKKEVAGMIAVVKAWAPADAVSINLDNGEYKCGCEGWKQVTWPDHRSVGYYWTVKSQSNKVADGTQSTEELLKNLERLAKSKKFDARAHEFACSALNLVRAQYSAERAKDQREADRTLQDVREPNVSAETAGNRGSMSMDQFIETMEANRDQDVDALDAALDTLIAKQGKQGSNGAAKHN